MICSFRFHKHFMESNERISAQSCELCARSGDKAWIYNVQHDDSFRSID